jgi:cell fate (sporulation/competence/biofilm development) regulator YlbF (YheA/YmcA/DUF963 family)
MDDKVFDDIEIAPPSVVKWAAQNFAAVLAGTSEFKMFKVAADRFQQDPVAQEALKVYQEKQNSWRALLMLNALRPEQRTELESLQNAFLNQHVVQDYFKAQEELTNLCQALGDRLSESIGLNYSSACGVSCCG